MIDRFFCCHVCACPTQRSEKQRSVLFETFRVSWGYAFGMLNVWARDGYECNGWKKGGKSAPHLEHVDVEGLQLTIHHTARRHTRRQGSALYL